MKTAPRRNDRRKPNPFAKAKPERGSRGAKTDPHGKRGRDKRARAAHARDVSAKAEKLVAPREPKAAPVLDSSQVRKLRGLAHHLEPLVHVGHAGVTDGVVAQVLQALLDHELIKARLHEPEDKKAMAKELATRTKSAICGLIGHTVILFRPHPERPKISIN
ncbi:MAG TPA: YhbY family RNA-binding protein [Polyangiales bacterium]|nr:YhbY family RNA-binding protein [Polyangiales bacterium]